MKMEIESLSPIHIGNGREISPMEYWVHEKFNRIDLDGLFGDEKFAPYEGRFISEARSNRYIGQYVPAAVLREHLSYSIPLTPEARTYLTRNQIVVKEYIKSGGRAYIPGSSLKGSILSGLFFHILGELYKDPDRRGVVQNALRRFGETRAYNEMLDEVFNTMNIDPSRGQKGRYFSWIELSDSTLTEPGQSLKVFLTKVSGSARGTPVPIICEGIEKGGKFSFQIKQKTGLRWKIEEILAHSDTFYRLVWKKTNPGLSVPEGGYLLRIGQGVSAYSTSLLLFAEQNKIGPEVYRLSGPKTKKVVEGDGTMGWVILKEIP